MPSDFPTQTTHRDVDVYAESTESLITEVAQRIYLAALTIERIEGAQRFRGNGHHAAQKISHYATTYLQGKVSPPKPRPDEHPQNY